jgi:phage baseplate assembly protein W
MRGIDSTTGKPLSSQSHLLQSIRDILTTPIGSRVMRRDYGSRLFELVDQPMSRGLAVDFIAATADALTKWEPRMKVRKVNLKELDSDGRFVFDLEAVLTINGQLIRLEGIKL